MRIFVLIPADFSFFFPIQAHNAPKDKGHDNLQPHSYINIDISNDFDINLHHSQIILIMLSYFMRRPQLIHFLSIITEESINVKASINIHHNSMDFDHKKREKFSPRFPIQGLRLLRMMNFNLKIIGLDEGHQEIYEKVFESDSFGNFNFKIPLTNTTKNIQIIQAFELATRPGLELHLGTYLPLQITPPKKVIICDFDKTLVETRWASTKELYHSLVRPLNNFPTLMESVDILKKSICDGYHPFIVSASPHFYEDAIRDWLYQTHIYTAGIFLKDYRKVLSPFEMSLTPKDLKIQGLYKLNHLLDILLMTGIPITSSSWVTILSPIPLSTSPWP